MPPKKRKKSNRKPAAYRPTVASHFLGVSQQGGGFRCQIKVRSEQREREFESIMQALYISIVSLYLPPQPRLCFCFRSRDWGRRFLHALCIHRDARAVLVLPTPLVRNTGLTHYIKGALLCLQFTQLALENTPPKRKKIVTTTTSCRSICARSAVIGL